MGGWADGKVGRGADSQTGRQAGPQVGGRCLQAKGPAHLRRAALLQPASSSTWVPACPPARPYQRPCPGHLVPLLRRTSCSHAAPSTDGATPVAGDLGPPAARSLPSRLYHNSSPFPHSAEPSFVSVPSRLEPRLLQGIWGRRLRGLLACRWCGPLQQRCSTAWRGGPAGAASLGEPPASTSPSCSRTTAGD